MNPSRKIVDYFWRGVDPRVYALVRIALAVTAMANLVDLWPRRLTYFSSSGMISDAAVRAVAAGKLYYSVFHWVSSDGGVTAVFVGAALAIVALGLGIGTRFAAALVWAWHLSYSHRAFPILHGWDAVLRSYSFLFLVSPTGRVWSLEHVFAPRDDDADDVPAYGLRLMQWQLFVLYTTTVWLKVVDPFWRNGQVLLYFSLSQYSRNPDDLFLVRHEWISALGTYLTIVTETAIPWLLWFRRTRPLGLLGGFGLHFGIWLSAPQLDVFSMCMITPYLAFLDRQDVDWLTGVWRRLARMRQKATSASPARSPSAT
jgi:hypothetical protein